MYHHNTFIDSPPANVPLEYTSSSPEMFANLSGGRFANFSVKVDTVCDLERICWSVIALRLFLCRVWIPNHHALNMT